MKVAKFGGTSLASAHQIRKVCHIITGDPERKIIVVSAPGKRFKEDIKVTDLLIALASKFLKDGQVKEELNDVVVRYREIAEGLELPEHIVYVIEEDLKKRLAQDTTNQKKFMDSLKASGEDNCAKLVAEYLRTMGYEAHYINPREAGLLVSNEYSNGQVLPESYERLKKLKNYSGILIFPGFFGYTIDGDLVTFPRGGSDITGSILAAAVKADLYENFTDVDSVFSVNPNIVENPKEIKKLTYTEMRELSYAGFSVFHDEALVPAFQAKIPVCIKNTNNPNAPGTLIVAERETTDQPVSGIACDVGFCSINISKYLMNREVGFGRKLLQILEDEGLSYEHTPSGIDNISVVLREFDKETEKRIVERIQAELKVDDIYIQHDLALVMIVGEGMRRSVGITARAAKALANVNVNLEMINQGSSEVSIMFGIKANDADKAVIALYEEFFKNQ
ncbi:aspartate kinase [Microaerobacter geothermalis]|uniref:aspartate kinase n=1 Tax=Microaerobacter geothermalis TaxID=674972 RepID=UPI001F203324|nr:aspartate kinase [Microaerobacter geothermalis]MCF6093110.1 aspartate kinase [Microaerobacter geothermalis]